MWSRQSEGKDSAALAKQSAFVTRVMQDPYNPRKEIDSFYVEYG